jgi:hypothetical protein
VLTLADADFVVTPGPWLMIWTVCAFVWFLGGIATVAKGRWGWFLIGLPLGGLIWPPTALSRAKPGSIWDRASSRIADRRRSSQPL